MSIPRESGSAAAAARRVGTIAASVCALLLQLGCVSGQQRGTLHLTVTERGTGLPVTKAAVEVYPIDEPERAAKLGKTDDQGRVDFRLPRGAYRFEVEKTGFMQNEEDMNKLVQDNVNYATIQVEQLVEVFGFVSEPDDSPAENIHVMLENVKSGKIVTGATLADGSYLIKNVPAGRYNITWESISAMGDPTMQVKFSNAVTDKLLQGSKVELNVKLKREVKSRELSDEAHRKIIQRDQQAPGIN